MTLEYNALTDLSPEQRSAFIEWLTAHTVADLKNAASNQQALLQAIELYLQRATAANLAMEDIEDILGVNEPSIMDLAELSEADEEIIIDLVEAFLNR